MNLSSDALFPQAVGLAFAMADAGPHAAFLLAELAAALAGFLDTHEFLRGALVFQVVRIVEWENFRTSSQGPVAA